MNLGKDFPSAARRALKRAQWSGERFLLLRSPDGSYSTEALLRGGMQPMKGKKHVEYKDTEKLLRGGRVRTTAFGAMLAIVKPEDTLESVLLRWADVRA